MVFQQTKLGIIAKLLKSLIVLRHWDWHLWSRYRVEITGNPAEVAVMNAGVALSASLAARARNKAVSPWRNHFHLSASPFTFPFKARNQNFTRETKATKLEKVFSLAQWELLQHRNATAWGNVGRKKNKWRNRKFTLELPLSFHYGEQTFVPKQKQQKKARMTPSLTKQILIKNKNLWRNVRVAYDE